MNNLLDENLIAFAAGVRSLPGRPSISTGYRYALNGIRGVRLETIVAGGRRYTSREALRRFVAATTRAAEARSCLATPAVTTQSAVESEHLDRALEEKGL